MIQISGNDFTTMPTPARTLQVELGERSYPIYIGPGLLGDGQLLGRHLRGRRVAIITNETVAPLYVAKLREGLREALPTAVDVSEIVLPDGERHKTLDTLALIFDRLLESNCDRSTTIVALGGGVVGDLAGFAAACYQRGISFIQVPTTLLAQVDSSVGGKTGVNHPLGKNMIGAFHQPAAVLIDTSTLSTLPAREYSTGVAEIIKYGLIRDAAFYRWLQEHAEPLREREEATLAEAIERSCANKAAVVAADEREGGLRAILNFGHTFGHAIETAQNYDNWLHGEAVATGMVLATRLSAQLGMIDAKEVQTLGTLLEQFDLPVAPPAGIDAQGFLELMRRDKKTIEGRLHFVLLEGIGRAVVSSEVSDKDITALF